MKNLALNHIQYEPKKLSLAIVESMDSGCKVTDRNWFKNFMELVLKSNDLDLESFDRIEARRTVYSIKNDFN